MFSPAQIPNSITVARIALVAPIGLLLWYGAVREALLLMAVASASDALDGWLARHFGWMSRFGAAMDPVADKLLVGTVFVIFAVKGIIPIWVVLIVIGRDLVIMMGAVAYRLLFEGYNPKLRSFPRNEFLFKRARDYWSLDIRDVASLDRVYQPMARMFDAAAYRDPGYPETKVWARWKWE